VGDKMEEKELIEMKREYYKEIDKIKREHKLFKTSVSSIANLFIPGIGFFFYGSSYVKGLTSFILFSSYNLVFFNWIVDEVDSAFRVIYYSPAIIIWIISTVMVASLDD
jgi:hypothetical protein